MGDGFMFNGEYKWVEARDDGLHAGIFFDMPDDLAEDFRDVLEDSSLTWELTVVEENENE